MNLIKVSRGHWLGQELPNAVVERAINYQIGTLTFRATLVVERRPFAQSSRRVEINVKVGTGHYEKDMRRPKTCTAQVARASFFLALVSTLAGVAIFSFIAAQVLRTSAVISEQFSM